MMINKVVVCPICGEKTWLRIQDGGYLNAYPIRVNCMNCRALLRGMYIMADGIGPRGLTMYNAAVEECETNPHVSESNTVSDKEKVVMNAMYVAELSGELPCKHVSVYSGGLPTSPFLNATSQLESVEDRIARLKYFTYNMDEWNKTKRTAFQLLEDGSIEFISKALNNRIGEYVYECNHYLKSLHCLQEVVLEESKYLSRQESVRRIEEIRRNAPIETRSATGNHGLLRRTFLLFAQALANRRTSLRDKKLYLAETLDKTGFLR